MKRTQFIAAIVGIVAVVGLVAVNLAGDDIDDPAESAASPSSSAEDEDAAADDAAAADVSETEPSETDVDETTDAEVPDPDEPPILDPVPGTLNDLDGWLQTDNDEFSDFDGTVRVVQFWTFGCINCKNTLDNLNALYTEYEPKGLEVIGVHAPEFDYEKDPGAIAAAAEELDVTWPIALDTRKTNFRSWQTGRRFWPRTYVLDSEGNVRFDRIGEGAYDELNATVAYLIDNDL